MKTIQNQILVLFPFSDELKVVRSSFLLVISFPLWLDRNLLPRFPPYYMGGPYAPIFGNIDLICCCICCFCCYCSSCIGECCVRYTETLQGLTFYHSNISLILASVLQVSIYYKVPNWLHVEGLHSCCCC